MRVTENVLEDLDGKHYDVIPGFMAQGGGYDVSYDEQALRDLVDRIVAAKTGLEPSVITSTRGA